MSCIYYPLRFQKDIVGVKALISLGSEINTMIPAYVLKLGLKVRHTNVGAQKINSFILKTIGIFLASFQVENISGRAWFFQETLYGDGSRYAFSHPQQFKCPVCREGTYLEVLYHRQGSTNH